MMWQKVRTDSHAFMNCSAKLSKQKIPEKLAIANICL